MYNHKKCCGDTMVNDVDRESSDAADVQQDDHEDPDFTELEDDDADVEQEISLHLGHFGHLSERGTLREDSLREYLYWPKRGLTHPEREVIIFLRSLECGQGASMRQTQSSLDYAHLCGGRAALLPRNAKTCWKIVTKVPTPFMHPNTHVTLKRYSQTLLYNVTQQCYSAMLLCVFLHRLMQTSLRLLGR